MAVELSLKEIRKTIPEQVTLVAVSKTYPKEAILEAYAEGQRVFGENRVQELAEKQAALPADIDWHLIGHLQKNKVKYIAPFVSLIHAVDDVDLLKEINKAGRKAGRIIPCLIQLYIAQEETKFGFSYDEARSFFDAFNIADYPFVKVCGLMGMASFTSDTGQVRAEFRNLAAFFNEIRTGSLSQVPYFNQLSMGMSGDYKIAIEEGSTLVRIGSAIFGVR